MTYEKFLKDHGRLRVDDKMRGAHQIAWELTYGPVPPGLHVLHRCDVPPCINPGHLWLGTNADNQRDRHLKGRTKLPILTLLTRMVGQ